VPVFTNFNLTKGSDGALIIDLTPPVNVGGWGVRFAVTRRFNSTSGLISERLANSGFGGGQSGITVLDSGAGRFMITPPTPEELSGMQAGNYAYQFERTDSGGRGPLTQGFILLGVNQKF
jgi:hypothetical protein